MTYATLLKTIRNKLLLTQTELAVILNVSYASINRWENKKMQSNDEDKKKN